MSKIKVKRRSPVAVRKAAAARTAADLVDALAAPPLGIDSADWLFWAGHVLISAADAVAARRDVILGDEGDGT